MVHVDQTQWYALIVSAVALIASGASAFYAWRQTQIFQKSAATSERSAKAAEDSAKAATAAANFGSRAWVTVTGVEATEHDDLQVPKSATVYYFNSGATPAFGVSSQAWLRAFNREPELLPMHERGAVRHEDLGAGCRDKAAALLGPPHDARRIAEGKMQLYFYGEMKYSDVFGQPHIVNWCYQYLPQTQQFCPAEPRQIPRAL